MKRCILIAVIIIVAICNNVNSQTINEKNDTVKIKNLDQIIVTGNRIPVKLSSNPAATGIVLPDDINAVPRSIAADEALRLVPGVRIDNQANGERLHMSIRGQGILSERGLRGIKVIIDGITINDPTGFASDLYDVDWATVGKIEVIRGSASALYGGSASAGILNIQTQNGGDKPINGTFFTSVGSNGFGKGLLQLDGTKDDINYRITYSRSRGDGYRDHTRFWSSNLSEKITWTASPKFKLTQVFMKTDFFNQNAEGLSYDDATNNPLIANSDANPFNEYQKTGKITTGLCGDLTINEHSNLQFNGFIRNTAYKETSNKAADYRDITAPGFSIQYNYKCGTQKIANTFSVGADVQWQSIKEHKFKSLKDTTRIDSFDETNLEDTLILANQTIDQYGWGAYIANVTEFNKKLSLTVSARYDALHNKLADFLPSINNLSGSKDFDKLTGRAGITYNFTKAFNVYANWGMGFIPPATEELASNPKSFGGFNDNLVPATSMSEEIGVRGTIKDRLFYEINAFLLNTKDDFFRFKLYPARGNQEVFYGNCGNSNRKGIEASVKWNPIDPLMISVAYTFSNFTYTSPDSIKNQYLPNCPKYQLYAEASYKFTKRLSLTVSSEYQSIWYIFTDPTNYQISQDGFNLYHAQVTYKWNICKLNGELSLYAKNIFDTKYIAFTEPDPDKNSYQPGSGRELFVNLKVHF